MGAFLRALIMWADDAARVAGRFVGRVGGRAAAGGTSAAGAAGSVIVWQNRATSVFLWLFRGINSVSLAITSFIGLRWIHDKFVSPFLGTVINTLSGLKGLTQWLPLAFLIGGAYWFWSNRK